MVNIKTDKCPQCGGVVIKLAGKAADLCHDLCLKCREAKQREPEKSA